MRVSVGVVVYGVECAGGFLAEEVGSGAHFLLVTFVEISESHSISVTRARTKTMLV